MSADAATPAVEARGLTKFYGSSRGVVDLDLNVGPGEVFGFLGPNGAGKTTTIRMLLDLIRPTRGAARVMGFDTRRDGLEARRRIAYLPSDLNLPERFSAREVLGHLARLSEGRAGEAVTRLAGRLELDLDRRISELSKGNRQKVGVVATFAADRPLLILDEPTIGLDPLRQEDVQELIREAAAEGRTVFLSSHALDQVQHVADRVAIIREGRLVAVEEMASLRHRALRRVEVRFAAPVDQATLSAIPGVRDVTVSGSVARLHVEGPMDALVKELARSEVVSLISEEPELDEIFLSFYGRSHEG